MNQQIMSRMKQEHSFGQLEPKYRQKVSVYLIADKGEALYQDHYNIDLNELAKRLYSQAFMYGERYIIRSSCGYVERIRA